jgi:hypothetical protein
MLVRATAFVLAVSFVSPAFAADLACDPSITAKTTLADLQKTYGTANVITGDVDGPEGTTMSATTIFPKDEAKTFIVYWWDEEKHERLSGYTIAASGTGPGGLKVGMSIKDVQAINGKPFKLSGFYWDYGGNANFEGGKLASLPDNCFVNVTFNPSIDPPNDKISTAISGEKDLMSNMKEFAIVKPVVQSIDIGFPDPDAPADEATDDGSSSAAD